MTITVDSTAEQTTLGINGTAAGTTTHALATVTVTVTVSFRSGFRAETGLLPEDVGNMEHAYDDVAIAPST